MDIKKLLLYFAVAMLGSLIWMNWQQDFGPKKQQQTQQQVSNTGVPEMGPPETTASSGSEGFAPPTYQNDQRHAAAADASSAKPKENQTAMPSPSNVVTIKTDVLSLAINKAGGNIIDAKLLNYAKSVKEKNQPVEILSANPEQLYDVQSGVTGIKDFSLNYKSAQNAYVLPTGEKSMQVILTATTAQGMQVSKTYTFTQGSYTIEEKIDLTNKSGKTWNGSFFSQITRKNIVGSSKLYSRSYNGAAISSHDNLYQKVTFKDLSKQPLSTNIEGGWVAMQQPYFLTAWVPQTHAENHFYSQMYGTGEKGEGNVFVVGYVSPAVNLASGQSKASSSSLYVGPELASQLSTLAPGLDLTIDYGWFWFLSKPIFYVMSAIHHVVGNWGWSIVLVTLLIKLIFYPLSAKSYKSMAKMRDIAPRLQALRERYKDDRQELAKATMEFYKREKVSPAGGCLPMLVQIPVFIALYWVLIESVQLRQAPFIFWIQDLSIKDPLYVLPVLMAASMFIQQKLSPPPPDPTQAKMMMLLPVVFLFVFSSFPAGLVLYWLTNNVLSLIQQWYVMKTYNLKK